MIEPNPDFANVGHAVWVGGAKSCDRTAGQFDGVVHIWKPANIADGMACRRVLAGTDGGLVVEWREDQGIGDLSIPLRIIAAYARSVPGPLLVHCASGSCRSTALAVACKVARGSEVFAAIEAVVRGVFRSRGFFVGWRQETMAEIIRWAQSEEATAGRSILETTAGAAP